MKILRYILFPVVPIYLLVTLLRNKLYDWRIFKSSEFTTPTICVGNLSVGGTGKTPMIEYLIRLLKDDFNIATLSRGYKRSTNGFIIADRNATADSIGDEPFQFYSKFDDIIVSVDADRCKGISSLMALDDPPHVILLDDAFQHRKVKAGFNILLTAYDDLYVNDIPLPTGNLREPKSGARRADIIVVTKCPDRMSENDKQRIVKMLMPKEHQQVFFSWIAYSENIKNQFDEKPLSFLADKKLTLVTGIANAKPLLMYLKSGGLNFEHLKFSDHHQFTSSDIENLKTKAFILTTEKDFMRLSAHFKSERNLYYLPIELRMDQPTAYEKTIKSAVRWTV